MTCTFRSAFDFPGYSLRRLPLSALFIVLLIPKDEVLAQNPAAPSDAFQSASPTSDIPLGLPTAAPSAASPTLPAPTDNANYASSPTNNPGSSHTNVLNYYFLLLAVFIFVFLIGYWTLVHRRRKRLGLVRGRQQNALAADMERWPTTRGDGTDGGSHAHNRPSGGGWWHRRGHSGPDVREEGLDERGEAPPAYVKEMEPVHLQPGGDGAGEEGMELRNMDREEGKPPDYQEQHPPQGSTSR